MLVGCDRVRDTVSPVLPPPLRTRYFGIRLLVLWSVCRTLYYQYSPPLCVLGCGFLVMSLDVRSSLTSTPPPPRLRGCIYASTEVCHALLPTIVRFVLAEAYSLHTCLARFSRGTLLAHLDALPELSLSTAWVLFPVAGFESTRPPPFFRLSAIGAECTSSSTHVRPWVRIC